MLLSTSTNICAFQRGRQRLPVEFSIDVCAAAGYRVLDINWCMAMNPDSPLRGADWQAYVRHIGEYAGEKGIRFTQSHLPYYDMFGEKDRAKAAQMEELIRRSIIASGMLGVRWAVTHPGTVREAGQDMDVCRQRNLEYFSPHVEEAKRAGVGIALENDFEYQPGMPPGRVYCASVYELADLCDAFGDEDHVGACYDFGHANLTGGRHRENLRVLGRRLKAVHVADNHGFADEHLMPFYGAIDWEDAMAGLADIDYQGELTYEIQEFGRYLPKELKYLAVEQSIVIGQKLLAYYERAKAGA